MAEYMGFTGVKFQSEITGLMGPYLELVFGPTLCRKNIWEVIFLRKKKIPPPNPNTRTRHPIKPPPVCQETKATNSTQVFRHSWPIPKSQLCTEGPLGRIRLGIFWSRHQGRIDPRGLAPYTHGGAGGRLAVDGWSISWGFCRRSSRVFFWVFFGDILKNKVAPLPLDIE